jgi:hypothetical protein
MLNLLEHHSETRRRLAMKTLILSLLPLLALSACATPSPEERVRSKLIAAGLTPPMANCMAERLVDRLSIQELRRLGSVAKLQDREIGEMTVEQFLHHIRALGDPHILKVVTTAGIGCAIAT